MLSADRRRRQDASGLIVGPFHYSEQLVEWAQHILLRLQPNFYTIFSKFSFFQWVTAARRVVSTTGGGLAGLLLVRLMLPHRPPGCWAAARHRQPGRRDRHCLSPVCAG